MLGSQFGGKSPHLLYNPTHHLGYSRKKRLWSIKGKKSNRTYQLAFLKSQKPLRIDIRHHQKNTAWIRKKEVTASKNQLISCFEMFFKSHLCIFLLVFRHPLLRQICLPSFLPALKKSGAERRGGANLVVSKTVDQTEGGKNNRFTPPKV